ncbi:MAG: hypothetical protein HKO70_06380 [Acidimicrobiia bacterium]|nr:hypothetical protein [Acidimicrobiia bacterium]
MKLFTDAKWALVGGAVTAASLFVGVAAVGRIGSFEGLRLLESILPTVRFMASSVLTAGVTVLALMLTLIGLTFTSEWEFSETHFRRLRRIALVTTFTIVLSVVVLLFISLPIEEADTLKTYYDVAYYAVAGASSLLGGAVVAVILMLYQTISGLVAIGLPKGQSDLIEPAREGAEREPSPV